MPFRIQFDGSVRPLCCAGCEAVANTILGAGLHAYYRERTRDALTPILRDRRPGDRDIETLLKIDAVQADYVAVRDDVTATGTTHEAVLYVDGITCAACVWLAESALASVSGVVAANVHPITHRATVRWDAGRADVASLVARLRQVGLDAQPALASARFTARQRGRRQALTALGVALLGMMQVMMFTVPLYFAAPDDISADARALMGWAGMVLTLPVLLYSARTFFIGAWRDLACLQISMDLPVALAIIAIFATSTISLVAGGNDVYFDSISMFVFLLLAARYLESSARESSLQWIERLTNAAPSVAMRLAGFPLTRDGETVATATLNAGDVIQVSTGEIVAADGEIIEGCSEFDESLLTGESQPVPRRVHAQLTGGSLNLGAPVLLKVTRVGAASTLVHLRRLTEQALSARPRFTGITDRVVRAAIRGIAPLTFLLALAAALIWWWIDPAKSFSVAIAVLAVTCPCALALAAPAAQAIATTRLARAGLLITRAGTLEKLAAATSVIFDKTGTLTDGIPGIESMQCLGSRNEDACLALAVALEAGSLHPAARALTAYRTLHDCEPLPAIFNWRSIHGAGVEGDTPQRTLRVGKRDFVEAIVGCPLPMHVSSDATLFLGEQGQWLAAFVLGDRVKTDAATTVCALRATGLVTTLLSGDRRDRVAQVARTLGFLPDNFFAEHSPAQKFAFAQTHHQHGDTWIAVGDGINDAPLLGAASVSIAMGAGSDLTRLTADAVLLSPHLAPLAAARGMALRMQRIVRQNFAWAIAYNVIAVPLAMAGMISPAWAAIGMATSSLLVVANSLRLARD